MNLATKLGIVIIRCNFLICKQRRNHFGLRTYWIMRHLQLERSRLLESAQNNALFAIANKLQFMVLIIIGGRLKEPFISHGESYARLISRSIIVFQIFRHQSLKAGAHNSRWTTWMAEQFLLNLHAGNIFGCVLRPLLNLPAILCAEESTVLTCGMYPV